MDLLNFLKDWSEVWALLIPLIIIVLFKPGSKQIRPVILYVILGLILNFIATFMLKYHYLVPSYLYVNNMSNNNLLYNLHSMARVLLLSWYIINIKKYKASIILKIFLIGYLIFVLLDFTLIESPLFFSTRIYSAESIVLLIMCIFYFFRSMEDESRTDWLKHPSFPICTGIILYEAITFFIFLFFYPLSEKNPEFFVATMQIYSLAFILFCILLSLAFYRYSKQLNQTSEKL